MMGREAGEGAEIRSVGRALDLLEIMQQAAPAGIQVREAADHRGVEPATASRLLATLVAHG
jgi:DNA-binding IclR family transcriptional regulator